MCCQVILESSINQRGSCDGSLWSVKFSLGETTVLNPRRLAQPFLLLRKCQTNRQTGKLTKYNQARRCQSLIFLRDGERLGHYVTTFNLKFFCSSFWLYPL